MKPSTDALNKWLQTFIIHPLFHNVKIHKWDSTTGQLEWDNVPQYRNGYNDFVNEQLFTIRLFSCLDENKKFIQRMTFVIKTPTLFVPRYMQPDDFKTFDNIKLRDIIEFKKISDQYLFSNAIRNIFYIRPPITYTYEKNLEVYCREYKRFNDFKEAMFGYFSNCEKINAKLKALKQDFKKGE